MLLFLFARISVAEFNGFDSEETGKWHISFIRLYRVKELLF